MSARFIVNVEIAICRADSYLMIVCSAQESHAPGTLSFPGGTVEHGSLATNVLEETARREALEEAGRMLAPELAYVESKSFVIDDNEPVVDVVFLARYQSGESLAGDPAQVASPVWLSAGEIQRHPDSQPRTIDSIRLAEACRLALGWSWIRRLSRAGIS